jgi:hypothetical protein
MASKVYLHIGAPKTGTTYLQQVMHANQDALEAQGVRYAAGTFHNDRVWATEVLRGFTFRNRPKQAPGAWDRILRQVREWDGPVVVSHEFFGACTAEQALRAHRDLAPAEVHLVFTARDYISQAGAVWQERLKYGFAVPFSEFDLDNDTPVWSWRTQDVPAILERWRHDLPPERVHVVTVPPPGSPPGLLWERFSSVVGIGPEGVNTTIPAANTSLGLVETELLRRVDDHAWSVLETPQDRTRMLRDLLANTVLSRGSRERFTVTAPQAEELVSRGKEAVAQLEKAGYDVVGSLDELMPDAELLSSRTPDDATERELLDAALDAIVGLLEDAQRTRAPRRAHLRDGRGTSPTKPQRAAGTAAGPRAAVDRVVRAARRRLRRP